MNQFRSILPWHTPKNAACLDDLAIMRERIFQTMMLVVSVLSCFLYFVLIRSTIARNNWIDIFFFTMIIIFVWSLTLFRFLPYPVRSTGILLITFLITLYFLGQSGLSGHAQLFLLTFLIMSAILIGAKALGISLMIGLITLSVFAAGMIQGWIPAPPPGVNGNPTSQLDWLLTGLFLLIGTALTGIPLVVIINNLHNSLRKQKVLSARLEEERSSLEERVTSRTVDLERRLLQLRTAAEISRSISSVLDPDELLQQVVNLLAEQARLYYAGVFLLNESGTYAILKAGSGKAGQAMIAEGHRLQVGGSSMVGWTTATRQARIALDVGEEAVRFNNPHLPLTRSELALPITGKNRVIGALTVQSDQPKAFDDHDILILQGIADSLAIAIDNAQLFRQNQIDMEEIRALNQQYLEHAWAEVNSRGDHQYTYQVSNSQTDQGSHSFQAPIVIREQPIGKIALDTEGKVLTPEEIAMVKAITTQTALALESARLLDETQRRARLEEKLNQMTAEFWRATEIKDVLQTTLKTIGRLPAISEVSVHLMPVEVHQDAETHNDDTKAGSS
jgi:GAF domain-containing protein